MYNLKSKKTNVRKEATPNPGEPSACKYYCPRSRQNHPPANSGPKRTKCLQVFMHQPTPEPHASKRETLETYLLLGSHTVQNKAR